MSLDQQKILGSKPQPRSVWPQPTRSAQKLVLCEGNRPHRPDCQLDVPPFLKKSLQGLKTELLAQLGQRQGNYGVPRCPAPNGWQPTCLQKLPLRMGLGIPSSPESEAPALEGQTIPRGLPVVPPESVEVLEGETAGCWHKQLKSCRLPSGWSLSVVARLPPGACRFRPETDPFPPAESSDSRSTADGDTEFSFRSFTAPTRWWSSGLQMKSLLGSRGQPHVNSDPAPGDAGLAEGCLSAP